MKRTKFSKTQYNWVQINPEKGYEEIKRCLGSKCLGIRQDYDVVGEHTFYYYDRCPLSRGLRVATSTQKVEAGYYEVFVPRNYRLPTNFSFEFSYTEDSQEKFNSMVEYANNH